MNDKLLELSNNLKTQIDKIKVVITLLENPNTKVNDSITLHCLKNNDSSTYIGIHRNADALRGLGEPLNNEIQDIINENRDRILIRLKRRLKVLEEEFDSI